MGDGGGLTIGEGGGLMTGEGGGLMIGDGGGDIMGDGGGLMTGDGGGEIIGDGGGLIIGEGGGDTTGEGGGDEMDDIDVVALPLGDIIGDMKNVIDLTSPADDRLSISLCAFCITSKSISFGSQSLGMIPLSSNSSFSCSYNALKSSSSLKSAVNLSKVRKSCASLNL